MAFILAQSISPIVLPGIGLVFWTSLLFILVWLLLGKVAFGPIAQALKDRNESIQGALKSAEAAKEEMAKLKSDNEALLREARSERDKMLAEAKQTADQMVADAQEAARGEADKIIRAAQAAIETEKKNAMSLIQSTAAELSLGIAEKVIRKELKSDAEHETLVKAYLEDNNLN